jgi:hypothetical protein
LSTIFFDTLSTVMSHPNHSSHLIQLNNRLTIIWVYHNKEVMSRSKHTRFAKGMFGYTNPRGD